jgi:hypothetical protein
VWIDLIAWGYQVSPHAFSLKPLQCALAVADTGGFRPAADRCHVFRSSPSAPLVAGEDLVGRVRRLLADADVRTVWQCLAGAVRRPARAPQRRREPPAPRARLVRVGLRANGGHR